MWFLSHGQEDLLEKDMSILSSIHAWRIPWTEEPGGLWSIGSQRIKHELKQLSIHIYVPEELWTEICGWLTSPTQWTRALVSSGSW